MTIDTTSPEASGNERFTYLVNGTRYSTNDAVQKGRDLLQKAHFAPASEHVLIELMRPGSKSIGLDEEVDLSEPGREEFRAFASDRVFTFTVDELGYEWGAAKITDPELRDISGTPEGKELVLERQDEEDVPLPHDGVVDLAERGTEHIRTKARHYVIIVNGREETVAGSHISYAQLVALAFNPVPSGPDVIFTITYRKGPPENPKGTLPEGESVSIKNRMIFDVIQTNRS